MLPVVSILVPAYNAAPYIKGCLDSILAQSHGRCQVVVVDDGSSDGTGRICQDYAARYANVEAVTLRHAGVAAARNELLARAKGEYALFVDADDWIEPGMVERLLACRSDIAVCGMDGSPAFSAEFDREQAVREFVRHDRLHGKLINKLIRRSLLDGLAFDAGITYGEDALMVWRALQRAERVSVVPDRLYHYRMHADSISGWPFTPAKMSAWEVWRGISADVTERYPQFLSLSLARWGLECLSLLRLASLAHWPHDDNVRLLQSCVAEHLPMMARSGLASAKEIAYAWAVSHWYGFGRVYYFMHKMKPK